MSKMILIEEATVQQVLEALRVVTRELLAIRDEIAERGGRPLINVFHQRLWDSSHEAYTDKAIPAAIALREALAQPAQQEQQKNDCGFGAGCCYQATRIEQLEAEVVRLKKAADQPAQRTWVGLTDVEIWDAIRPLTPSDKVCTALIKVSIDEYRAIEAAAIRNRSNK